MTAGPTLDELAARYLVPGTAENPTFREDTEWEPIVDGVAYFAQLRSLLDRAGPGDRVLVAGLNMEPEMDLTDRRPGEEGYESLAERFARLVADGVDVRVLLTGAVFSGSVPGIAIGPFRANAFAALRFREHPGLRGRVLLDWSGAGIGCHHQKIVLCQVGTATGDGELTAFVGGLDLSANRYDDEPHDRLSIGDERWGWHDGAARLRGPAAARVWEVYRSRWAEATSLPPRRFLAAPEGAVRAAPEGAVRAVPEGADRAAPRRGEAHGLDRYWTPMNPEPHAPPLPPAPPTPPRDAPGTAVQVLRSFRPWRIDAFGTLYRRHWTTLPRDGVHEVYHALAAAIRGARRYVYLEDQYFFEVPGGRRAYRLYGLLRDAAARGVKVVLVCSGRRDPVEAGVNKFRRKVTGDVQRGVIDQLEPADRGNVIMHRIEDLTVHTKLLLVDDVVAAVGSANFFSRSMRGTDTELSTVLVTTGDQVRDLRVRLWAEHLRTELDDTLRASLRDVDLALGIWRPEWLPPDAPAGTWRVPGYPAGFDPQERVLVPVGPWPEPSPRPLRRAAEGVRKGAARVAGSAGRSSS